MKSIDLRKTLLLLIIFLLLWVPSIQAHTLHVAEDTNNSSVLTNRVLGNQMVFDVRDVGGTRRTFARFDLSTLPNGITGSGIEKATLRLFVNDVFTAGNVDLHRVTSAWDESTLTFNNSPTFNATAFFQDVAFAKNDEKHFVTVDITAEVKDWIDNPANDFGIALVPDGIHVRFNSKENQGTSHPLEIEVALIGTEGPQGLQGLQGTAGTNGTNGIDGATGATGAIGPQGPMGLTGPAGPQGDQGIQGIAGTNGTNGVDGAIGPQGPIGESGKDDADGVEITFTRELQYDPGTGAVPAIDINGTALVISQTDPTVILGGQARTVLATSDIPNTTPQLQQVVIDMPESLLSGNYKLKLWNTQGDSEVFIPLNAITLHDGSTWTQATASAAFSARGKGEVLSYNGKLWIIGGETPSVSNEVWSSLDGITWTQATANAGWSARSGHSSVVFDNKMWVMGGYNGSSYQTDVWYSTDGSNWTQATANAASGGRLNFEAVVFNNKIWVMAGYTSGNVLKSDVWSTSDGVIWTQETANAAFSNRYNFSSLVHDSKLWVMGGYGSGYLNDVWSSSDGITWTQVTSSAGWSARNESASVVYDGKMWILGGVNPSGGNEVWFSSNGSSWTLATPDAGWGSTRYASDATVFNDRIWVIAGYSNGYKNDVWHTSD